VDCKITITAESSHSSENFNLAKIQKEIENETVAAVNDAIVNSDSTVIPVDADVTAESSPSYPRGDPRFRIFQLQRKFSDVIDTWFPAGNWAKRRKDFIRRRSIQMSKSYTKLSESCDFGIDARTDENR